MEVRSQRLELRVFSVDRELSLRKSTHTPPLALCTEVPASGFCQIPYSAAFLSTFFRVAAAAALALLRKCESGDVSGEPDRNVQLGEGRLADAVRVGALC